MRLPHTHARAPTGRPRARTNCSRAENAGALAFYKALGYVPVERPPPAARAFADDDDTTADADADTADADAEATGDGEASMLSQMSQASIIQEAPQAGAVELQLVVGGV